MRLGCLVGAVVLGLLSPSVAAAKPRAVPSTVVPGMPVELRGVPGKAKSVRVAGRRAKLVAGKGIRFVLPKVEAGLPRVDVRTTRGRRVRVRIRVAALGPASGSQSLSTDGTLEPGSYELEVVASARAEAGPSHSPQATGLATATATLSLSP